MTNTVCFWSCLPVLKTNPSSRHSHFELFWNLFRIVTKYESFSDFAKCNLAIFRKGQSYWFNLYHSFFKQSASTSVVILLLLFLHLWPWNVWLLNFSHYEINRCFEFLRLVWFSSFTNWRTINLANDLQLIWRIDIFRTTKHVLHFCFHSRSFFV